MTSFIFPTCTSINGKMLPTGTFRVENLWQTNTEILRNLALAPPARPDQPDCLLLKFLREPSLLRHGVPFASSGTLHFSEASP